MSAIRNGQMILKQKHPGFVKPFFDFSEKFFLCFDGFLIDGLYMTNSVSP